MSLFSAHLVVLSLENGTITPVSYGTITGCDIKFSGHKHNKYTGFSAGGTRGFVAIGTPCSIYYIHWRYIDFWKIVQLGKRQGNECKIVRHL